MTALPMVLSQVSSLARPLTAAGVGGFSPRQLFRSGEKGFALDLTDMSTLYQDTGRTALVTATGQPIGSASDISGNGVNANAVANDNRRPTFNGYGSFDGSNDVLITSSIDFSGTDKLTMIVGIMKNSDAVRQFAVELSANGSLNPGSFSFEAPGAIAQQYRFTLYGSGAAQVAATTYPASTPNVVSVYHDIAGATSVQEITLRIDGLAPTRSEVASPAGTGNFGNYPVHIGARGTSTLPLNGRIYRLIVIGRALTSQEIENAERWCGDPF